MEENTDNVVALPTAKDETKQVFVGNTGNTAEVTEEFRPAQTELSQHGRDLVRKAGELHCPTGAKLIGAAAVFYYSDQSFVLRPQFFSACQTDVGDVVENHADLGWKALQSALMKSYGRNDPKRRN